MRQAEVYDKNVLAGILTQTDDGNFVFRYDDIYYMDSTKYAISLTLPKTQQEYLSDFLFPFFLICFRKALINVFNVMFIK